MLATGLTLASPALQHRVRVDGNYATSVVNLLCIEGVASALDPTYNLLDESEALLTAHTVSAVRSKAAILAFALDPQTKTATYCLLSMCM